MTNTIIFMFAAILIVAVLLFAVITLTKTRPKHLDVEKYRVKWLEIEQHLKRDDVSSYHMTIFNADKLLDQALKDLCVKGDTMGERMKNYRQVFKNNDALWSAHKLRNRIAHEMDISISYDQARRALADIKHALKDVGAI